MLTMDKISKIERSATMRKVHNKDTSPEILVRSYLFSKGLRYRKNDKRYPGHPDIVLPKYKTIVFVNGCFWHLHDCGTYFMPQSNTNYWIPKLKKNKLRDETNIRKLQEMGWHVIVVWECQLKKKNRQKTLDCLYKQIINNEQR